MHLMNIAKGLLAEKLGGDNAAIGGVMDSLLGGGDKMDIGGLVSGLKEKGMGDVADSWLGDGENAEISADQLKDVLPQIIDKASSGGSLMDSLGGASGLAGMAKKLF